MVEVRTGRVMAARMQQYDAARWQRVQLFQQRINAHTVGFAVEPRIGFNPEACTLEDRNVVFPRRVADPYAGIREVLFQEICTHFQRPRATQRLDSRHALLREHRVVRTKQQRRDGVAVGV